jgi:hypothetical protein
MGMALTSSHDNISNVAKSSASTPIWKTKRERRQHWHISGVKTSNKPNKPLIQHPSSQAFLQHTTLS